METEIIVAIGILIALVFLATIDQAFSLLSDVSLRRISSDEEVASKKRSIQFLREILENRPRFRFALSSTIQVLLICFTVLLTEIVSNYTSNKLRLIFFALTIGLAATVILRQIVPRLLVQNNTENKLLFLLPAIRPIYSVVSFFVEPIASRSRSKENKKVEQAGTLETSDERDDDNSEDFQALMEVGAAEGILEEDDREMIETMVEFGETRAGEIMTPRTEIVAVPVGTLIKDARDVLIEEKVSRLPVYRDQIDSIEGIVYVRDLLAALATGRKEETVETIMREAFFVPETKTADDLLKSMQREHVQLAIVIDEYGGVAGLVTVEDILEEIVGEIEDEDIEKEDTIEIREAGKGSYDVVGSTEVEQIEELFELELEDDDYTTIAGLVVTEAGYVPKVGDHLDLKGLHIEILDADEKRITLLRLQKDESSNAD